MDIKAALAEMDAELPDAAQPQGGLEIDPQALQEALASLGAEVPDAQPEAPQEELTAEQKALTPGYYEQHGEPGLGRPDTGAEIAEGALAGAAASMFETKDFLFGEPADDEVSDLRASVEGRTAQLKEDSILGGASVSIGQFAMGMYGLGKFTGAAKLLPWFGKGASAVTASRAGAAGAEVAKAATVGAVAFDPHEERLSNLIENTALANPLTKFLAADPTDSAAEGRFKSALESIGLDVAIIGTLGAAAKVYKALRNGDEAGARAAAEAGEAEARGPVGAGTPEDPIVLDEVVVPNADAPSPTAVVDDLAEAPAPSQATPEPDIEVSSVPNPTEAAAQAGVDLAGTPLPNPRGRIQLTDENLDVVLKGMEADANAMQTHGGWYQAIDAGHTFGRGEGVPWVKLGQAPDVDDYTARLVDVAEDRINTIKGGDVLSDARVQTLINQRAALYNEDPASVIGMVQQSGQMAARMVADMEVGYLITNRMLQDTYALAQRIKVGDFSEFGSAEAAGKELKRRMSLAASSYAASRSITANAGRAVRRHRREFSITPEDVAKLDEMDADRLVELLDATQGNPRNLGKLANPSIWTKALDAAQFLYINSLLSGPKTQLINAISNSYMIGARPLERIIGSVPGAIAGDPVSRSILTQNVRQYAYLGAAFREGFEQAKTAFLRGDSVMAPHKTELYDPNRRAMQMGAGNGYKPLTSLSNLLHNTFLTAIPQAIGLPTRSLGFVDELVKQTVYRSKVLANAHTQAVFEGQAAGLKGAELATFVKTKVADKLDNAFDGDGRALYPAELREAQTATFQNDLAPNSLGKGIQTLTANVPLLKFVLPFVKTPANVLGYGWRMTPLLNMAHGEFRAALKGSMGPEAQAQAMGQHGMGVLFMSSAAFLASDGAITGGGPKDYKLNQELRATGWQPYSIVYTREDGSKSYVPYNRYDPVAIPFGIVADLQDAIAALGEDADEQTVMEMTGSVIGALGIGLSKQFTSKTYLQGIGQFMDAVTEPEDKGGAVVRQMAANFIPYSAAQRQFNQDPYMREARTVADQMLATVPGLSDRVPARYDAFGDPILARRGLWSNDKDALVDREMQRLALEAGNSPQRVQPTPRAGVDLRTITMSDGRNAYEVYQQLAGHLPRALPIKELVARRIQSKAYQNAPDGEATTKGTKSYILAGAMARYRAAALRRVEQDPVVREAFLKRQRAVADAYRENRERDEAEAAGIGEAFGVDLGTLFGTNP